METECENGGECRNQVKTPSKKKDANLFLPKLKPNKDAK
jgi:hypothetical protein